MKLEHKKELAANALGVGKGRIAFNTSRLSDIKEAITKQDIRDLYADGAIMIKEIKGTKTKEKRRTRRRAGSIRKKPFSRKRKYIILTRKFRGYLNELLKHEKITKEKWKEMRKEVKSKSFRSKAHLKERMGIK